MRYCVVINLEGKELFRSASYDFEMALKKSREWTKKNNPKHDRLKRVSCVEETVTVKHLPVRPL